jgi:hypothetical protein
MFLFIVGLALAVNIGPISPDAPAREPQLSTNGSIVGPAFGAGKGIYFSASTNAGKTFSAPAKVAEAEIVPLTRHRGPRLAFSGDAIVITAVVGRTLAEGPHAHGLPSDGDLIVWRSTDGGRTWSKGLASMMWLVLQPKVCMRSRLTRGVISLRPGSTNAAGTGRSFLERNRLTAV